MKIIEVESIVVDDFILHRDGDKPAMITPNEKQVWCQHDKYHRDGDKPAIIYSGGRKCWWKHGLRHRENGPAIIYRKGDYSWWKHGERVYGNNKT